MAGLGNKGRVGFGHHTYRKGPEEKVMGQKTTPKPVLRNENAKDLKTKISLALLTVRRPQGGGGGKRQGKTGDLWNRVGSHICGTRTRLGVLRGKKKEKGSSKKKKTGWGLRGKGGRTQNQKVEESAEDRLVGEKKRKICRRCSQKTQDVHKGFRRMRLLAKRGLLSTAP